MSLQLLPPHSWTPGNPKPGIYLEVPERHYHQTGDLSVNADSGISSSMAKKTDQEGTLSQYLLDSGTKTRSLDLGSALHLAVSQPKVFEKRVRLRHGPGASQPTD